jgi:hypothetical protein
LKIRQSFGLVLLAMASVLAGQGLAGAEDAGQMPPAVESAADATSIDQIRKADDAARARSAAFAKQVREVDMLIEEMERLAFQVDLRIAKIRRGEFERSCEGAEDEATALLQAIRVFAGMRKEAETLCAGVAADDAAGQEICANRRASLKERGADLGRKRTELAAACPAALPTEGK